MGTNILRTKIFKPEPFSRRKSSLQPHYQEMDVFIESSGNTNKIQEIDTVSADIASPESEAVAVADEKAPKDIENAIGKTQYINI